MFLRVKLNLHRVRPGPGRIVNLPPFHTVRKMKLRIALLHLLFKLLQAVQERDHRVVELRIPEEPEPAGPVEREFFVLIVQTIDVRVVPVRDQPVPPKHEPDFLRKGVQQQHRLSPRSVDFGPFDGYRGESTEPKVVDGSEVSFMPYVEGGVENVRFAEFIELCLCIVEIVVCTCLLFFELE